MKRRKGQLGLWITVGVISLLLASANSLIYWEKASFDRAVQRLHEISTKLYLLRDKSPAEVERAMAGRGRMVEYPGQHIFVSHPDNAHFELVYADGKLLYTHQEPFERSMWALTVYHQVRIYVGFLLVAGWIAVLIAAFRLRNSRRKAAAWLVALAALFAFSRIMAETPEEMPRVDVDDWSQIISGGMLLVSLAILLWPRRKPSADDAPHCHKCGYNLTGNISGICPECGTPIADVVHTALAERLQDISTEEPGEAEEETSEETVQS